MNQPHGYFHAELYPNSQEPRPNYWNSPAHQERCGSMATQDYFGIRGDGNSPWIRETKSESFFEQTGVAACNIGTGFLPHQASMRTDFEFLNYTAENSLAICRTQPSLVPPGCVPRSVTDMRGYLSAVDSSQENSNAAWPYSFEDVLNEETVPYLPSTKQKTVANEPAPSESFFYDVDDSNTTIGTVLNNGTFKCSMMKCATKSFRRPAELKRHYNTTHAAQKPEFWCGEPFCDRSAGIGGRPFHRKYRLHDHMRKMHGREVEVSGDDDDEDD